MTGDYEKMLESDKGPKWIGMDFGTGKSVTVTAYRTECGKLVIEDIIEEDE